MNLEIPIMCSVVVRTQRHGRMTKWKGRAASLAPCALAAFLSIASLAGGASAQDIAITGGGHLTVR